MSHTPVPSLTDTIIQHHAWFSAWHHAALYPEATRSVEAERIAPPPDFGLWLHEAQQSLPHNQPVFEKLRAMHDRLHTMARLILMKTPDGHPIPRTDYEQLTNKYQEFMAELIRCERAFTAVTTLDPLTGLRMRHGMVDDIAREVSRSNRTKRPFCVAILDIDHFKSINDSYGHDAGDFVLSSVANHISRSIRPYDDAYRMGGEEFLITFKETNLPLAYVILERLRKTMEGWHIALPGGRALSITASFGYAMATNDVSAEALIKKADDALYRAKQHGRNMVVAAE